MIRMIQANSAAHAKAYFSDALSKADYYVDGQELNGRIQGRLVERLEIAGQATKDAFFALCENAHPKSGEALTPRTNQERRVGYDINFHCPKSVSILHALSKDDHLLKAFEASVQETMRDIERDAKTRVRKDGQYDDRATGELIWADFTHQTARPTDGSAPDPHLHSHCFVFNATWDEQEQRVKAGQFGDIKRDMPYYQAAFHKRLSDRLMELGYQVRRTDKSFEVKGVPSQVIELFSKRTDEIGRVAEERGITSAKELDGLGARTRSAKQKGMSMPELKTEWRRQIAELEAVGGGGEDAPVRFAPVKNVPALSAGQCVDHALAHGFERASVLQDKRLLAESFRFGIGHAEVTVGTIESGFKTDSRIVHVKEKGRILCTTREVLAEEQRMVELARKGQGQMMPLYRDMPDVKLEGQQLTAVRNLLLNPHRVSIVRGAAGSGKTTLMKEAVKHIEAAGRKVTVVAPTAEASRGVLKSEGFANAETVARLLQNQDLQKELQGGVLWVDEAGLLGTKDMTKLLLLATERNAKLILGGDTRQHSSVVRGDALRILNTVAGIKTAEVSKIFRQKNADYRKAVDDLSNGDIALGFAKLDQLGAIAIIDPLAPNKKLVDDYATATKKGKSALIVSPTHAQGQAVTAEVRTALREAKLLGKRELEAVKLSNLNLTEAQKADRRSYKEGQLIQFNQNVKGAKRGTLWTVQSESEGQVRLHSSEGATLILPLDKSSSFDVMARSTISLAKGDKVRITRNGFDQNGKRLNNGDALEVASVSKAGYIRLRNPASKSSFTLSSEFGHIDHAYCVTSHAAQGKTVDEVFIAQPAATFVATDAKQFYVSVSRGRERCHIYTDSKEELLEHASEIGDRQSALELVKGRNARELARQRLTRSAAERVTILTGPEIDARHYHDIDYEPEI